MTKILAFTSPAQGHLYPVAPVLAELVSRGHEVTVLTLPDSEQALAQFGLTVRALPPALARDTLHDWATTARIPALRAALRALIERIPEEIQALRGAIIAERPEALLIDLTAPGAQILAAASGLPWASWASTLLPIPSRDVPPFGPGLRPRADLLGRIRDNTLQWFLTRRWNEVLPQLNHMRQYYGLDQLDNAVDYLRQPPLLLNFTAPPFDYPRGDWPLSVHQIGPGLWAPEAEPPAWLADIDRPIALVTCSTEFQDDGRLAQTAMDALADSEFCTIVTTGAVDPETLTVPPNARAESFVPHQLILDRADVVVTHGGLGITQKALAAGVPVCVVPFGRGQSEVARRVVTNEAGTWVSAKRLTPATLRAGIDKAMTLRAGAARVAAGFAAAGGTLRGAELLERHFAGHPIGHGIWSGTTPTHSSHPYPTNEVAPQITRGEPDPIILPPNDSPPSEDRYWTTWQRRDR
ncbi:MGT family glycosyltransferase [Nocardia tenerifensis]|uniref:MGT family glycosyltransferase n=1 Tax=Nocardia tenerifensis TaxID=228006 RepID=A0A318K599_9NOCA|nr:glycosyltransferase [Nocardia tenerifensis]PXX64280.1 MGT family glycosyltransferase [Nocardia tenerifensis]